MFNHSRESKHWLEQGQVETNWLLPKWPVVILAASSVPIKQDIMSDHLSFPSSCSFMPGKCFSEPLFKMYQLEEGNCPGLTTILYIYLDIYSQDQIDKTGSFMLPDLSAVQGSVAYALPGYNCLGWYRDKMNNLYRFQVQVGKCNHNSL